MAKLKPENRIKKLQKQLEQARTIFLCQGFMETDMPDSMKEKIGKFLKETENG